MIDDVSVAWVILAADASEVSMILKCDVSLE